MSNNFIILNSENRIPLQVYSFTALGEQTIANALFQDVHTCIHVWTCYSILAKDIRYYAMLKLHRQESDYKLKDETYQPHCLKQWGNGVLIF